MIGIWYAAKSSKVLPKKYGIPMAVPPSSPKIHHYQGEVHVQSLAACHDDDDYVQDILKEEKGYRPSPLPDVPVQASNRQAMNTTRIRVVELETAYAVVVFRSFLPWPPQLRAIRS
jgi:hypothetical protein